MNPCGKCLVPRAGWIPAILVQGLLMSGCGGGLDPILGTPSFGAAPTVTATSPASATPPLTGVAVGSPVTVSFSKPMSAASLTASSFTLACPAGTPVTATVSYDATTSVATLTPSAALPPSTLCEATGTTAAQDSTGIALVSPCVWRFVTAPLADTTRPTVVLTVPAADAMAVAVNTRVTATFSEDMAPDTINISSTPAVWTPAGSRSSAGDRPRPSHRDQTARANARTRA